VPKDKGKEMGKRFFKAIDQFHKTKDAFYAKLDKTYDDNLKLKVAICEDAESLAAREDFGDAAAEVSLLWDRWKAVGHVSQKVSDSIYERFKKALDAYYAKKKDGDKAFVTSLKANLEAKIEICEKLIDLASEKPTEDEINELREEFFAIGQVPRADLEAIRARFKEALNTALDAIEGISEAKKSTLRYFDGARAQRKPDSRPRQGSGGGGPGDRRQQGGGSPLVSIRNKINDIENQIHSYQNNLSFFANSNSRTALYSSSRKKSFSVGFGILEISMFSSLYANLTFLGISFLAARLADVILFSSGRFVRASTASNTDLVKPSCAN
jgi:hypothetical protein